MCSAYSPDSSEKKAIDPAWSPDGKSIAFFSDESGEYALHIVDQTGLGAVKKINLGNPPSFFYGPLWSPDSKKIAYTDKRMNLWYVDVEKGTPVKVASDRYEDPSSTMNETWSPDSKWLTYAKFLENHMRNVFVYSLETGKKSRIPMGPATCAIRCSTRMESRFTSRPARTWDSPSVGWIFPAFSIRCREASMQWS